jgi:hypothetical protein
MRTGIRISMAKFKNTGGISRPSGPAERELRLRERETGRGPTRGMEETGGIGKNAVELLL